jgi:hypothetical protein
MVADLDTTADAVIDAVRASLERMDPLMYCESCATDAAKVILEAAARESIGIVLWPEYDWASGTWTYHHHSLTEECPNGNE